MSTHFDFVSAVSESRSPFFREEIPRNASEISISVKVNFLSGESFPLLIYPYTHRVVIDPIFFLLENKLRKKKKKQTTRF